MLARVLLPLTLSTLMLSASLAFAQKKVPNGAKVLILSGGQRSHHAYRRQTYLLQRLLEDSKQFEVTVCEDAALLETPALQKYDLIVAMADRRDDEHRLTEAQQKALLKFVRDGKGFFSFHAFCCADKTWVPEMRELLGGVLAHFGKPDTKVRTGKFPVKILIADHPVTKGVADFEHQDELYYELQTQGDLKPLAAARYQDKDWPILWTRNFGKGRVCVSVFGHCGVNPKEKDPLEHAPFRQLILQGIAWTANRDLK